MQHKISKKAIITFTATLAVLVVGLFVYKSVIVPSRNEMKSLKQQIIDLKIQNERLSTIKEVNQSKGSNASVYSTDRYDYEIQTQYGGNDYANQKLIRINKQTKKQEVAINDIKGLAGLIVNMLVGIFAQPAHSDIVFINSFLDATDNSTSSLYRFDIKTNKLNKMKINSLYKDSLNPQALSPNQTKLVYAPYEDDYGDAKVMYLINLLNDAYQPLVTLTGNETFNAGYSLVTDGDIKWIDDNTIRYAIYDQSKKSIDSDVYQSPNEILIGYREFKLPK